MVANFLYNFTKSYHITKSLFVGYFIIIAAVFYFLFFTIFGEKGLIKLYDLKKRSESIELEKQKLSNEVQVKKNMVNGISLKSLDLDLLDEQSRKILGYVGKNEIVVYQDNQIKPTK